MVSPTQAWSGLIGLVLILELEGYSGFDLTNYAYVVNESGRFYIDTGKFKQHDQLCPVTEIFFEMYIDMVRG